MENAKEREGREKDDRNGILSCRFSSRSSHSLNIKKIKQMNKQMALECKLSSLFHFFTSPHVSLSSLFHFFTFPHMKLSSLFHFHFPPFSSVLTQLHFQASLSGATFVFLSFHFPLSRKSRPPSPASNRSRPPPFSPLSALSAKIK